MFTSRPPVFLSVNRFLFLSQSVFHFWRLMLRIINISVKVVFNSVSMKLISPDCQPYASFKVRSIFDSFIHIPWSFYKSYRSQNRFKISPWEKTILTLRWRKSRFDFLSSLRKNKKSSSSVLLSDSARVRTRRSICWKQVSFLLTQTTWFQTRSFVNLSNFSNLISTLEYWFVLINIPWT